MQAAEPAQEVKITPRYAHYWPQQHAWLSRMYPPELTWHLPFSLHALRPGFVGGLYCLLTGVLVQQWAAARRGERHLNPFRPALDQEERKKGEGTPEEGGPPFQDAA